jgi:hypothetical protein
LVSKVLVGLGRSQLSFGIDDCPRRCPADGEQVQEGTEGRFVSQSLTDPVCGAVGQIGGRGDRLVQIGDKVIIERAHFLQQRLAPLASVHVSVDAAGRVADQPEL